MFAEIITAIQETFRRKSSPSSDLETTQVEHPLVEAAKLLTWWLGWPGHPGIADPRCWASKEDLVALEASQKPATLSK